MMTSSTLLSILVELLWALPGLCVSLVGIRVAVHRWRRHPAVSGLVVTSLGMMIAVNLAQRIGTRLIVNQINWGGWDAESIGLYLGIVGMVALPVRAVAWVLLLIALFGWRDSVQHSMQPHPPAFQFSIRGLMIATVAVAFLCAAGRLLVSLLGESAGILLNMLDELPIFVCLGIGVWLGIARIPRNPGPMKLALFGLGLLATSLILSMGMHLWLKATRSYDLLALITFMTAVLTVMGATGWALIIAAVFWRDDATVASPFAKAAGTQSSPLNVPL